MTCLGCSGQVAELEFKARPVWPLGKCFLQKRKKNCSVSFLKQGMREGGGGREEGGGDGVLCRGDTFSSNLPLPSMLPSARPMAISPTKRAKALSPRPPAPWELQLYKARVPMSPEHGLVLQPAFPWCLQNLGGFLSPPSPILSLMFFTLSFPASREAGRPLMPGGGRLHA